MSGQKVPVNRTLVGLLALACLLAAGGIAWKFSGEESWQLWQAGFTRVGLVMSAFWLALPSGGREAAWANVSPATLAGACLGMIALMRVPLRIVLPVFILVALIGCVLRPREKKRPRVRRS